MPSLNLDESDGWPDFRESIWGPYHILQYNRYDKYIGKLLKDSKYTKWNLYGDLDPMCRYSSVQDVLPPREDGPVTETPGKCSRAGALKGYLYYDRDYYPERNVRYDATLNPWRYMTPFFRNPFNDFTSQITAVPLDTCAPLEIKAMECLEYYGIRQGQKVCEAYYDDLLECRQRPLAKLRNVAIKMEQNKRWIEYMNGEREWDTIYKANPKVNTPYEPFRRMGDQHGPIV